MWKIFMVFSLLMQLNSNSHQYLRSSSVHFAWINPHNNRILLFIPYR